MTLQFCFLLFALFLGGALALLAYRAVNSGTDFFLISIFGQTYSFRNPGNYVSRNHAGQNSYFLTGPYIRPVNEFLNAFANSTEKHIEFSHEDIKPGSSASPLLRAIEGIDYDRIRLRLRIISNLDPVVNFKMEEGIIRFTCGLPNSPRGFKLRSQFAPYGQSILLEKL
jgi:hypothetical protein